VGTRRVASCKCLADGRDEMFQTRAWLDEVFNLLSDPMLLFRD
jgi:hypothetical protein